MSTTGEMRKGRERRTGLNGELLERSLELLVIGGGGTGSVAAQSERECTQGRNGVLTRSCDVALPWPRPSSSPANALASRHRIQILTWRREEEGGLQIFPVNLAFPPVFPPRGAMQRYPIFLRSLSPFACTPPTVIRRVYSNSPSIPKPADKLLLAAQRLVAIALDNSDGSIESNKRKREVEELQRALKEVEDGDQVSQSRIASPRLS